MNVKDELLKLFGEGMRVDCSEKNKKLLLGLGIYVYNSVMNFDTEAGDFKSLEKKEGSF